VARLLVPGINNKILTFCNEFIKAPYELVDYVAIFFHRRDYDAQRLNSPAFRGFMRKVRWNDGLSLMKEVIRA